MRSDVTDNAALDDERASLTELERELAAILADVLVRRAIAELQSEDEEAA